ncbi:MAG: single-stranded DNA-binding protein [Ruminococcaceae bacterium]|nr:single-stranded DNA-binding protein [Oscillospiraceae bacterium]
MYNKVIMMGRIVNDLELKTTPAGVNVCSFRIAVDRRFQTKGEERKSDFFNVVAWRQQAEFLTRFFSKGKMILVEGEMTTRQYTDKNGNPNTWYEIVADRLSFTGEKATSGTGGGYGGGYGAPPIPEEPAGYGGGYSAPQSAPAQQPAQQTAPAADFSSADSDDYPF